MESGSTSSRGALNTEADSDEMVVLGIVLFVVLTFVAALIAGVGSLAATIVSAVMTAALLLFRSGGGDLHS